MEKEQSDDSLLDQNDNAESYNEMATEIEVNLAAAFYF